MQITTRYTLTPAEALRGTRAFKRTWYLASVGVGLALLLMGLWALILSPGSREMGVFMGLNGLLFAVLPEAVLRSARRRRGSSAFSPQEVVLDDRGLTLRTESTEGNLAWNAFSEIQRRGGFWIFRMGASQAVLLPERALDATAGAELERFLADRKLMAR